MKRMNHLLKTAIMSFSVMCAVGGGAAFEVSAGILTDGGEEPSVIDTGVYTDEIGKGTDHAMFDAKGRFVRANCFPDYQFRQYLEESSESSEIVTGTVSASEQSTSLETTGCGSMETMTAAVSVNEEPTQSSELLETSETFKTIESQQAASTVEAEVTSLNESIESTIEPVEETFSSVQAVESSAADISSDALEESTIPVPASTATAETTISESFLPETTAAEAVVTETETAETAVQSLHHPDVLEVVPSQEETAPIQTVPVSESQMETTGFAESIPVETEALPAPDLRIKISGTEMIVYDGTSIIQTIALDLYGCQPNSEKSWMLYDGNGDGYSDVEVDYLDENGQSQSLFFCYDAAGRQLVYGM